MFELPRSWPKRILLLLAAFAFTWVGVTHFTNPEFFVAIVPPYLPAALALVYISGVAEIAGGLGLLPKATRQWAGWGLLALLVAVYPANIHMAMNPEDFPEATPTQLYVRLAMQFVMFAWVWWVSKPDAGDTVAAPA